MRPRSLTRLGLAFGSLVIALSGAALAQEGNFGALSDALNQAPDCWTLDRSDEAAVFAITGQNAGCGRLLIENATASDADFGNRTIRVWVEQPTMAGGSAGLLYGYDESLPFHYALLITAGGRILFGRFFVASFPGVTPDSGYSTIITVPPNAGLLRDGPNELRIDEDGEMLSLFVNGVAIGRVGGARSMGEGHAGITALRFGDFVFTGYEEIVVPRRPGPAAAPVTIGETVLGDDATWGPLAAAFDRELANIDDHWTVELSDDALTLTTESEDAGMAFLYPVAIRDDLDPDLFGRRTLTTTVAITDDGGSSRAGLVYWYSSSLYYVFTLSRDREGARRAILWAMQDGTPQPMTAIPVEDRAVELGLVETGTTLGVMIDGKIVSWVEGAFGDGMPGIVAWGPGTYVFTGYGEAVASSDVAE